MKNIFPKIMIAVLVVTIATSVNIGLLKQFTVKAEDSGLIDIDMYLIAGQSNAAGYSTYTDLSEEEQNAKFTNVMYAGQTDKYVDGTSIGQDWLDYSEYKDYVTVGYGTNSTRMGPEYGMAKVLNDVYSSTKKAFIFKTAAGSTTLKNSTNTSGVKYGNWYPRSLWSEGYEPDITSTTSSKKGYMYKLFVENFRTVYNNLKENGYNPVVKGMVWMQGESDLDLGCTGYDTLLKQFISDIRTDIYKITLDEKTIDMKFVIGKIATTFSTPVNTKVPIINALQDKVAKDMDYVETIETSDLIITYYDGNVVKSKGVDNYHFSGKDDITLGERFANKLLSMEESTDGRVKVTCDNGQATALLEENQITVSNITANLGYKLSSISVNDTKYYYNGQSGYPIETYSNNQMVLDVSSLGDVIRYNVEVCFEADMRNLTIVNDSTKGSIVVNPSESEQKIGTVVTIEINPVEGYVVDTVKFNSDVLTAGTDGKYQITFAEENNLEVTYKEAESEEPSDDEAQTKSGCGASISYTIILTSLFVAILVISLKKKVRN